MANKISKMPQSMTGYPFDPKDPSRVLISGLFEETVTAGGSEREFLTYLAPGMHYNRNVIVAAPPAGADPAEFLETSGLRRLADEQQVFVSLLVPKGGAWDKTGADADYMNAVNVCVQARVYYVTLLGDNIYALGFGDGADIAHQACMKSTSQWSGLGTVGGLTPGAMLNAAVSVGGTDRDLDEAKVQGDKCQLPVWMAVDALEGTNKAVCEYWKSQNDDRGEVLSGEGADLICMPLPAVKYSQVNEENIAQLRITLHRDTVDYPLLSAMWKYVGAARRHRNFGMKALRYHRDPEALGAEHRTLEMEGLTREWWEYVPETVRRAGAPAPLVVCMHGRGMDGGSFFDICAMNSVAEERGFIAVFPTASLFQQKPNGVTNVSLWDERDYTGEKDVRFIRAMIADIQSRRAVDSSRIYACGQSSGGHMSAVLGGSASDLFAAVAPWSAMGAMEDPTPILPEHKMPYLVLYGDMDPGMAGKGEEPGSLAPNTAAYRDALISHMELNPEPLQYVCGEISYSVYHDRDNVPMLVFGRVKNMPHANYPRESWISYDEFFSKFSRLPDGTLLYMGRPVR